MKHYMISTILVTLFFVGCGKGEQELGPVIPEALTVDTWKGLESAVKYDGATLDRLRESNPEFAKEKDWDKFMREVFVPERNKDLPNQ